MRIALGVLLAGLAVQGSVRAQGWSRILGDPAAARTSAHAIPLAGGDTLVVLSVMRPDASRETSLVRLDASGDASWERRLSVAGGQDVADALPIQTSSGAVVVLGTVLGCPWMAGLEPDGDLAWQQSFACGECGGMIAADATADDAVLAMLSCRASSDTSPFDIGLVKLGADGTIAWAASLETTSGELWPSAICATPDGGAAISGQWFDPAAPFPGLFLVGFVLKVGAAGGIAWGRSVTSDVDFGALSLDTIETTATGLVVTGEFLGGPGGEALVAALDGAGDLSWARLFEGDRGTSLAVLADGTIEVLSGYSQASRTHLAQTGELLARSLLDREAHLFQDAADPSGGSVIAGRLQSPWMAIVQRLDARGNLSSPCMAWTPATSAEPPVDIRLTAMTVPELQLSAVATTVAVASVPWATPIACARCAPLACWDPVAVPALPCEGAPVELSAVVTGGESPVVSWDLDGDGAADAFGNPATVTLPAGAQVVTLLVEDACSDGPQSCRVPLAIDVLAAPPIGEVSDVLAGDAPLRVLAADAGVVVETVTGASAYNIYAGAIGSWTPTGAAGTTCAAAATDRGDGTSLLPFAMQAGTWIDVTAASACVEGPTGRDSSGALRQLRAGWSLCGPTP